MEVLVDLRERQSTEYFPLVRVEKVLLFEGTAHQVLFEFEVVGDVLLEVSHMFRRL